MGSADMSEEKDLLTPEEVEEIRDEFIERLELSLTYTVRHYRKRFIVVIGGAPGSGKTTAANKLAATTDAFHVQSNSARELLREHHKKWGQNVRLVIQAVIKDIIARELSVVLDGMMLEEEERNIIRELAIEYKAVVLFGAMVCNPELTEQRARKRYADNKPSSFEDWRCDRAKFGEYVTSIHTRTKMVDELLAKESTNPSERIWRISNDTTEDDLANRLQPIWQDISRRL